MWAPFPNIAPGVRQRGLGFQRLFNLVQLQKSRNWLTRLCQSKHGQLRRNEVSSLNYFGCQLFRRRNCLSIIRRNWHHLYFYQFAHFLRLFSSAERFPLSLVIQLLIYKRQSHQWLGWHFYILSHSRFCW